MYGFGVVGQELLAGGHAHAHAPSWERTTTVGISETITPVGTFALRAGPPRLPVSPGLASQPWFNPMLIQLAGFLALGENWNGYGEHPIHESAVKRAVDVLDTICSDGPAPQVVPMSDGGVQIEWAAGGFEIEVEVPPFGPAQILIVEPSGNEVEMAASSSRSPAWGQLRDQIAQMGPLAV